MDTNIANLMGAQPGVEEAGTVLIQRHKDAGTPAPAQMLSMLGLRLMTPGFHRVPPEERGGVALFLAVLCEKTTALWDGIRDGTDPQAGHLALEEVTTQAVRETDISDTQLSAAWTSLQATEPLMARLNNEGRKHLWQALGVTLRHFAEHIDVYTAAAAAVRAELDVQQAMNQKAAVIEGVGGIPPTMMN